MLLSTIGANSTIGNAVLAVLQVLDTKPNEHAGAWWWSQEAKPKGLSSMMA